MIVDFIAIGIIFVCLVAVVFLVSKKFPALASINIEILQKHKQEKIKKGILENRLKRKIKAFSISQIFSSSNDNKKHPMLDKVLAYIKNLEQRHRHKDQQEAIVDKDEILKKKTILLTEAQRLFEQSKFPEAEDKYIEIISLDSKSVEAYRGLAELYVEKKDFDHAKEVYQYLLKVNSEDDSVYESLGRIATHKGDFQEAERDYLKSISMNNQVASYRVDLGEMYEATGEHQKAWASLQEAAKLEPNNPRILDALISAAINIKNKDEAGRYYYKLKEVNPENEKLKDFEKAIKEI